MRDLKRRRNKRKSSGHHIILDVFFKSFPKELESVVRCQKMFGSALHGADFGVLQESFQKFNPQGLTGFFLLSDSHFSFHTWPEKNYVAIDLFSCGNEKKTEKALRCVVDKLEKFEIEKIELDRLRRGFVYIMKGQ